MQRPLVGFKRLSLILSCLSCLVGCQWPLAYYMRDQVFPEDTASKIALAPVLLPAYVVCAVVDITMVNPVRGAANVPSTVTTIWEWENANPWVGRLALMPLKLIAIPLAAIGTVMFSEQFAYTDTPAAPKKILEH